MQEVPFILTEWQELNSSLYAPLSATKRIRYTCIAVSTNYIVLGATSGSIYLFSREPCSFQHLIPQPEGAVCQAQISPDEKIVALATVRGSICLIVLKPSIKIMTISNEHLGEKVTSLCWNDNSSEVYAGDESGKISVSLVSTFIANGMFQPPSCALMNLNSKIIQMSFESSLLLISTLNRCYICDTIQEEYKTIGNKPRDGEFGACFLGSSNQTLSEEINIFQRICVSEEDANTASNNEDGFLKIYCARPGSRLWEVTASGVVIKTHQFKEALAIPPLPVYKPSIGKVFELKKQDLSWPAQSINFVRIFRIIEKYLFCYSPNGLYVLYPENAKVLLWNDEFPDTIMAHIVSNKIYLMTSSGVFHCLDLTSTDLLLLKLYEKKMFTECLSMCQVLKSQLTISLIGDLYDSDHKQPAEFAKLLHPIISLIKSNFNLQPIQLESGMVIVNTGNSDIQKDPSFTSNRILEEIPSLDELDDSIISLKINGLCSQDKNANKETVKRNGESNQISEKPNEASVLQTAISDIQANLETLHLHLSSLEKDDTTEIQLKYILTTFVETLCNVKEKYKLSCNIQNYLFEVIRSAELNYYNSLLENLPIKLLQKINDLEIIEHLVKIFIEIDSFKNTECSCGFRYPIFGSNKLPEPKFSEIGIAMLKKLPDDQCRELCNRVPYLWREYLSCRGYSKGCLPNNCLILCLQTGDTIVLSSLLPTFQKAQWKIMAKCFKSINDGLCSNCGKPYEHCSTFKNFKIDWNGVINVVLKKEGPAKAMYLLYNIQDYFPNATFHKSVYQSVIFSKILNLHGVKHAFELDQSNSEQNSVCSPKVLSQLVQTLEKDTESPVKKDLLGSGPHDWGMRYNLASSMCPCCTLSLQTPVLLGNNGIALFPCGHAYHVNCMIKKKMSRCNLHNTQ